MFYSQISINSDINNLSELEMFIDEVMDNYHIEEQYYGILSVPLIESTKNAIIHGNKNNVQKKVTISIQKNDKEIQCSVSDEGSGFDYDSIIIDNLAGFPYESVGIQRLNRKGVAYTNIVQL